MKYAMLLAAVVIVTGCTTASETMVAVQDPDPVASGDSTWTGWGRWALRVQAYATLLITDRYPPFSLR